MYCTYTSNRKTVTHTHTPFPLWTNLQRAGCCTWLRLGRADWHRGLGTAHIPAWPRSARLSQHSGSSYSEAAARCHLASVSPSSPETPPGLSVGTSSDPPGFSLAPVSHLAHREALLGPQRKKTSLEPGARGARGLGLLVGVPRNCHPATGGCSCWWALGRRRARARHLSVCQRYP